MKAMALVAVHQAACWMGDRPTKDGWSLGQEMVGRDAEVPGWSCSEVQIGAARLTGQGDRGVLLAHMREMKKN